MHSNFSLVVKALSDKYDAGELSPLEYISELYTVQVPDSAEQENGGEKDV